MATFAEGLMTAILLVFFLYISLHPDKIRRRLCFVAGWGGIILIFIGSFFLIGRSRSVGIVAQVFTCVGLLVALIGAAGSVFPGALPMVEAAPTPPAQQTPPSVEEA